MPLARFARSRQTGLVSGSEPPDATDTHATEDGARQLLRASLLFVAIGMLLYAGLFCIAEQLVRRTGHTNAFYKIATLQERSVDWVILGASHAMPLDFDAFNAQMQTATGQRIVNLATQGAGPLYNRFVFEHFLRSHRAKNVLYIVDSFAFYSRTWNEERLTDPKLLARTPFDVQILRSLAWYARHEGVDVRGVADYATGFSKINNQARFEPDIWEGERQFERMYPSSKTASVKRIAYLYPDATPKQSLDRYVGELGQVIQSATATGATVVIVKTPVPTQFRELLPNESQFDATIERLARTQGIVFRDFSSTLPEARFYFDTDHLNRAGVTAFLSHGLQAVLVSGSRDE